MSKPTLKLDWCSHEAAKYAVEKWHYSRRMPVGKLTRVGVWESGRFIGCVLFDRGANRNIGSPYGLSAVEVCELVRVALNRHECPVSRILAVAIRFLRRSAPGLRLIVSYADPEQGHAGTIYQAGSWVYTGKNDSPQSQRVEVGKVIHKRSLFARDGTTAGSVCTKVLWKHKYLMPLDGDMRERVTPLSKPYPKRATSVDSDAPANHAGKGGVLS